MRGEYDMILPVHICEGANSYHGYPYVHLMNSPGVVLVVQKSRKRVEKTDKLVETLQEAWPVVMVTLLLTIMAGITIWALDTYKNPVEFPRSFPHGALEGCWWAFVTMTTVGYGDRAPKSHVGRVFGIVWITVGLAVCSFLTATLSSALTTTFVKQPESIMGKKIGVVDKFGFEVAVQQGALPKEYRTLRNAYNALVDNKVEGLLLELYSGSHFAAEHGGLEIDRNINSPYSLGIAASLDPNLTTTRRCLQNIQRYKTSAIVKIIERYARTKNTTLTDKSSPDDAVRLFDPNSERLRKMLYVLSTVVGLMCIMGILYEILRMRFSHSVKTAVACPAEHADDSLDGKLRRLERALSDISDELRRVKLQRQKADNMADMAFATPEIRQ
ncbi:uncharacterized protein LOC5514656 [Nematostella vectensis]|nr:uncharacterized protein LOC5514656 [Nematostella vectensis]